MQEMEIIPEDVTCVTKTILLSDQSSRIEERQIKAGNSSRNTDVLKPTLPECTTAQPVVFTLLCVGLSLLFEALSGGCRRYCLMSAGLSCLSPSARKICMAR